MSEVIIPMGALRAQALEALAEGELFKWSTTEGFVELTDAKTDIPIGIVINAVAEEDILNQTGSTEWFQKRGIVKVPLTFNHTAGTEVQAAALGAIAAYTDGYRFGCILTDGNSGDEAEIFIY